MRENGLSYRKTVRKYWGTKTRSEEDNYKSREKTWERIYLSEGEGRLYDGTTGPKCKRQTKVIVTIGNRGRSYCGEPVLVTPKSFETEHNAHIMHKILIPCCADNAL